ncbi:C-type lectin BfL-2-like [Daphnia carinata]|uniref:C-type lectin BfL-2-like n=1 Tax=Daphnia carinata TaxID=120202 RepID=UPI00286919A2|nr:C-type lectin BfL-2-like [Daphnia carinata]
MEHRKAFFFSALCFLVLVSGNEANNGDDRFLSGIDIIIDKPDLTTSPRPIVPTTQTTPRPTTRTTPLPPTPPTQKPPNPNECSNLQGFPCYKLPTGCVCPMNRQTPWIDAHNFCKANGRSLISFKSAAKQTEFETYLPSIIGKDNLFTTIGFWTSGLFCLEASTLCSMKNTWAWAATREEFSYTNWLAGEPNMSSSPKGACVRAVPTVRYQWDDIDCGQFLPFICE